MAYSGYGVARGLTFEVGSSATATGTIVSNGASGIVSGGATTGTIVQGGGTLTVEAGGTAAGDVVVGSGEADLGGSSRSQPPRFWAISNRFKRFNRRFIASPAGRRSLW